MTAEITMRIEVDRQVIIAKNEDDLVTDDNKIIVEKGLQQIVHIDRIHQGKTDTNHLETDINHQDAMIATNHLEEIPDTNHLEEIPDTNHLDEIQNTSHLDVIIIDLPIETIDPLNIAQIQPITVHVKVTIMQ
jgi:primase-polymerase (primpol)-like protein